MRTLLTALIGLAVLAPGAAAATPETCTQENILDAVRDAGEPTGEGFHQVICRDVNADGTRDALFSLRSGESENAGATHFGVVDGRSNILQFFREGYQLSLRVVSRKRFDVQQPIYRNGDREGQPTRFGFTKYVWTGRTFKARKGKRYSQPKNFNAGKVALD